ncbi:MAG: sigma 54-interacting transcriptional regulator [Desulfuromonadales bacterium]|nr:sigma 54-interacting transcriptional regulator [Desulfuromonadales bacterium]
MKLIDYHTILSRMGEGAVFADEQDRICFINAAAEQIRGIRSEKICGRSILSIHPPRSSADIGDLLQDFKAGRSAGAVRILALKDRIFENSYHPIWGEGGGYTGTLMVSRDVTERQLLEKENRELRARLTTLPPSGGLVGRSPAMKKVFDLIEATAPLDTTVLISGETGTGKELVAEALHRQSPRCQGPLVRINCAALPENLLEAELFGHERGAFTGAIARRRGKFELAEGGTIFLDEIGEMPLAAQAKLLRVLQEKTIQRLGGEKEIRVDVRIIAATHRDLRQEVAEGQFREDLFYRLNVIPLHLAPLRERREDILTLTEIFLAKFSRAMKRPVAGVCKSARSLLLAHDYPGNVRELENALERAVALCQGSYLQPEDLPDEFHPRKEAGAVGRVLTSGILEDARLSGEKKAIQKALLATGNRKAEAARLLGISRKTLWEKMKRLELEVSSA